MAEHYRGHRLSIDCPHCGARARVRSSRSLTALVRTASLQCTNVECGHTFGAQLAITHSIVPALRPNPDISLPVAPPRGHICSRPSNDNGGLEVPPSGVGPPVASTA